MSNEKAHALVLAETLMSISNGRLPESESIFAAAATELQTQHFRIKELEAMLESVGAGGVSAQRVTQAADHIEQDRKMVAAPVVLPEPDEYQYRMKPNWDDKLPWTPWEDCSKESAAIFRKLKEVHNWIYEVRERYTEQQVLALRAKDLDAVNLDRLGKALTKLGHATWVSQEAAAADMPRWVNALTSCVLEIPEAAPQPQADARDVGRHDAEIVAQTDAQACYSVDLNQNEQYRMQMAAISTAAIGFHASDDPIHPDYDTTTLRDVARLYAKYDALRKELEALKCSPQPDARDAERWRFIKRKLCLTGNGDGTCAMQALNLPARILGWPDVGELAIAQFLDGAIDAAIAAAKGE